MAQLWGGRLHRRKRTSWYTILMRPSLLTRNFTDRIFAAARRMSRCWQNRILTEEERDSIIEGLDGILKDVEEEIFLSHQNTKIFTVLWRQT